MTSEPSPRPVAVRPAAIMSEVGGHRSDLRARVSCCSEVRHRSATQDQSAGPAPPACACTAKHEPQSSHTLVARKGAPSPTRRPAGRDAMALTSGRAWRAATEATRAGVGAVEGEQDATQCPPKRVRPMIEATARSTRGSIAPGRHRASERDAVSLSAAPGEMAAARAAQHPKAAPSVSSARSLPCSTIGPDSSARADLAPSAHVTTADIASATEQDAAAHTTLAVSLPGCWFDHASAPASEGDDSAADDDENDDDAPSLVSKGLNEAHAGWEANARWSDVWAGPLPAAEEEPKKRRLLAASKREPCCDPGPLVPCFATTELASPERSGSWTVPTAVSPCGRVDDPAATSSAALRFTIPVGVATSHSGGSDTGPSSLLTDQPCCC